MKIILTEGEYATYMAEIGNQLGPVKDGKQIIHTTLLTMVGRIFAGGTLTVEKEEKKF